MIGWIRRLFSLITWFKPDAATTSPLPAALEQPVPTTPELTQPKRKYDSSYIHLRRDLTRLALRVLDRFEHLEKSKAHYAASDLHLLADLWGCDFLLLDEEIGKRMKGGDKWSAIEDATATELSQVVWPVDYAIATEIDADDEDNLAHQDGILLYRLHTVKPKDVRGKFSKVASKMMRYTIGYFYDNGRWSLFSGYVGLIGGKWIVLQDAASDYPVDIRQERDDWATMIMSCAFAARYEWHVAFGSILGGPRLLFPTNPSAALHLFKNRDVAPGKHRRDKLKHWVEQHYRDNDTDLAFVCHHLRGKTNFTWSGFICELFVSEYDLEMNEHFKKEAKEWRAQRKHNRVRVHLKKHHQPTMH